MYTQPTVHVVMILYIQYNPMITALWAPETFLKSMTWSCQTTDHNHITPRSRCGAIHVDYGSIGSLRSLSEVEKPVTLITNKTAPSVIKIGQQFQN